MPNSIWLCRIVVRDFYAKSPFSAYQKDLETLSFQPKHDHTHSYDVLILGGGFTGISAALELAENGVDVGLVEAYGIGNGGSGRNGGHLLPDWPSSFHHIEKHLSGDEAKLAWQIGMSTVDLARERIKKYNIDCDLQLGYVHAAYHKGHEHDLREMKRPMPNMVLRNYNFYQMKMPFVNMLAQAPINQLFMKQGQVIFSHLNICKALRVPPQRQAQIFIKTHW